MTLCGISLVRFEYPTQHCATGRRNLSIPNSCEKLGFLVNLVFRFTFMGKRAGLDNLLLSTDLSCPKLC